MRRLTWLTLLAAVLGVGGYASWQFCVSPPPRAIEVRPTSEAAVAAGAVAAPRAAAATTRGGRLVEQALATLDRRINVRAKLRQQTSLRGKQLPGTGAYWQQGAGNQRRTRWEATTLVAGQKASLLQVYDSTELWTDRQLPSSRDVTRVHLIRLHRELVTSPEAATASPEAVRQCQQLASGGLAGLLAELLQRFTFDEPTSLRYRDMAALAVIGRWKPEALARLAPGTVPLDDWPEQTPHHVLLILGQADLFPYVIEYRNAGDARLATTDAGRDLVANPLSRYEMFDVQFAVQMDPELFRYTPPEDGARDITSEIRARMHEALETVSTPSGAEGPKPTRTENVARPTSQPS